MFGQSDDTAREKTSFGEFCRELEGGNELAYLTTQALEDSDGCPRALAADHVYKLLEGAKTLRPQFLGHMAPVQYNMWFGRSKAGSSSGLHHDFHDNIYVLLRGSKEFRLFSPRCLDILRPEGVARKRAKLHSNGLISYVAGLREDGAPASAVREWHGAGEDSEEELERMLNEAMDGSENGSDADSTLPDSFCRASTTSNMPKILAGRHLTAKLDVGDLLYLPASWFHEVISYGGDIGGHLALNLWMAPPCQGATFEAPYEDGFWDFFVQKLLPKAFTAPATSCHEVIRGQKRRRLPFTHRPRLRQTERVMGFSWILHAFVRAFTSCFAMFRHLEGQKQPAQIRSGRHQAWAWPLRMSFGSVGLDLAVPSALDRGFKAGEGLTNGLCGTSTRVTSQAWGRILPAPSWTR